MRYVQNQRAFSYKHSQFKFPVVEGDDVRWWRNEVDGVWIAGMGADDKVKSPRMVEMLDIYIKWGGSPGSWWWIQKMIGWPTFSPVTATSARIQPALGPGSLLALGPGSLYLAKSVGDLLSKLKHRNIHPFGWLNQLV